MLVAVLVVLPVIILVKYHELQGVGKAKVQKIKLSLCIIKNHAMKTHGEVELLQLLDAGEL
jgi:hypothetical protein